MYSAIDGTSKSSHTSQSHVSPGNGCPSHRRLGKWQKSQVTISLSDRLSRVRRKRSSIVPLHLSLESSGCSSVLSASGVTVLLASGSVVISGMCQSSAPDTLAGA